MHYAQQLAMDTVVLVLQMSPQQGIGRLGTAIYSALQTVAWSNACSNHHSSALHIKAWGPVGLGSTLLFGLACFHTY